jgi:hypothetical protein
MFRNVRSMSGPVWSDLDGNGEVGRVLLASSSTSTASQAQR